jgi:hypothetical protein
MFVRAGKGVAAGTVLDVPAGTAFYDAGVTSRSALPYASVEGRAERRRLLANLRKSERLLAKLLSGHCSPTCAYGRRGRVRYVMRRIASSPGFTISAIRSSSRPR